MRIEAILFDIGGVLLTSPFEGFARYEISAGLPPDAIRKLNATNPDTNAWARFERGELDVAGFVEMFEFEAAGAGFDVSGSTVLDALKGEVRPAMITALQRCAERYKTALLTNNFVVNEDENKVGALAEMVDAVIASSEVGVRKPEPRFYQMACEALAVEPAHCVFLDDLGINLKPARAMGMTTIKVVEPAKAISELERLVGFPLG